MAKALEQRWPIKPEYRSAIVRRLIQIVADPSSSAREVTAAARALMFAESQNQSDEHKVIDVNVTTRNDNLDAIAADLGIEIGFIEAIEGETNRSTGCDAVEADRQAR